MHRVNLNNGVNIRTSGFAPFHKKLMALIVDSKLNLFSGIAPNI